MTEHTKLARFATRVKEARTAGRERSEERATQRFEQQKQRLEMHLQEEHTATVKEKKEKRESQA